MDLDDIPGYSLRRKLGSGSAGTVWQVRDLASGRNAVLKRVRLSAIADQEKLREDLAVLERIRSPHIARLLDFRETPTHWLLVSQYVVAGSLSELLSRRRPLSRGELVTLLTPLAEALDQLHRSGLIHGRVNPANTLFDADGRPVLTDTALYAVRGARPAEDVLALEALAQQAGADPTIFTPALFTTRPADLPRRLLSIAAPAPIDLAFPQTPPTTAPPRPKPQPTDDAPIERSRGALTPPPSRPAPTAGSDQRALSDPLPSSLPKPTAKSTRRRPLRRTRSFRRRFSIRRLHPAYGVLAAATLGAVVVLALALTTLHTLSTPTTPTARTHPSTTNRPSAAKSSGGGPAVESAGWVRRLSVLDARRARAFWTLDLAALDSIYVPGSRPWHADRALLSTYRKQNVRVQGLRIQIDSARITHRTPTTITLRTTDHLTAGRAVDSTGTATPLPPGTPTTRLITLVTTPTTPTWRITRITLA